MSSLEKGGMYNNVCHRCSSTSIDSIRPRWTAVFMLGNLYSIGYTLKMPYTVIVSETFRRWLRALRDRQAQARIAVRLDRVAEGNFGDHRSVGQGVSELRINVAQGYRVYYTIRDQTVVLLLCSGDKASQQQDIHRAQQMVREL